MSGGSFNYAFIHVDEFADKLKEKLDGRNQVDEDGCRPNAVEDATYDLLMMIETHARKTAALMKEVEWLYSGDTGMDTFRKRVAMIIPDYS